VRIARICDPEAREPFPYFCHNTTTYVSVEHDAPSQLLVINDQEPCWASIQVDRREVHAIRLTGKQAVIELHKLSAPAPHNDSFTDTLASLFNLRRVRPNCKSHTRLYAFQVVLQADTPQRPVLATYDFHILCPREYQEACAVHRQICTNPDVIAPDTISDRTEGRCCPDCKQTRHDRAS
jgi:hypothetical protein